MAYLGERDITFIQRKIEDRKITQSFRPHLGASVLGGPCMRRMWYGFRWSLNRDITPRLHRLFNRGHSEELVVIEDLINAGCKVKNTNLDETIINRFKTVLGVDLPNNEPVHANFAFGFGGATSDGIIYNLPDAPKTEHLLEVKTSNTKGFITMKSQGVKKANNAHFVQINIYMNLFGLKRCLYIMVCKETDERYYERVKYEPKVAKEYIKRAEYIIQSEVPPIRLSTDREYFECKYRCDFVGICHDGMAPDRNCRTCLNILFSSDGTNAEVICSKKDKVLNNRKQAKGCKKYKVDPCYGS